MLSSRIVDPNWGPIVVVVDVVKKDCFDLKRWMALVVDHQLIGMAMENGQEQYSGHQVKLSITNAVVNRDQKAILVAMNQGICSISWGNFQFGL